MSVDWSVSPKDVQQFEKQFNRLAPTNGIVSGDQAKKLFLQSGLPPVVLGEIWALSDLDADGRMNLHEFSIAMVLIKKKLAGQSLPQKLPPQLKKPFIFAAAPAPAPAQQVSSVQSKSQFSPLSQPIKSPVVSPVQQNIPAVVSPMQHTAPPVVSPMQHTAPPMHPAMLPPPAKSTGNVPTLMSFSHFPSMSATYPLNGNVHPMYATLPRRSFASPTSPTKNVVVSPASVSRTNLGSIPHQNKLRYTQTFNSTDEKHCGYLTGNQGRAILVKSGLTHTLLGKIWNLADCDKDGQLTCDEFCLAMHLTEHAKANGALPDVLPANLVPSISKPAAVTAASPIKSPTNGVAIADDLLGGLSFPTLPVSPTSEAGLAEKLMDSSFATPVSFEDKRKENFDKGHSELERRRALLREQQEREQAERMAKERAEQERKEQIKREQEEALREKQRLLEEQREEVKRKDIERREEARRKLDEQRQLEWEQRRRVQLLAEKKREKNARDELENSVGNLRQELEKLNGKKGELHIKIAQARSNVTDITSEINGMRCQRDEKINSMKEFQSEGQVWQGKMSLFVLTKNQLEQDYAAQAGSIQTGLVAANNSIAQKQTSIDTLKVKIQEIQRDSEEKLAAIQKADDELKTVNEELSELYKETQEFQDEFTSLQDQYIGKSTAPTPQAFARQATQSFDKNNQSFNEARSFGDAQSFEEVAQTFNGHGQSFDAPTHQTFDPGSVYENAWSTTNSVQADQWPSAEVQSEAPPGYQKYVSHYQFDARNDDEVSLVPGCVVWVKVDQSGAEQGWVAGQVDGKDGWFPENYVQPWPEEGATADAQSTSQVQAEPPMGEEPITGQGTSAPAGMQAQALYPWRAKKEHHLAFDKGDVITIVEQQDIWWSGELNGLVGWFPKSYVKPIGSTPAAREGEAGEPFVAIYDYQSAEKDDLNFQIGQLITVTHKDGEWWTGTIGDRVGIFPANYVAPQQATPQLSQAVQNSEILPANSTMSAVKKPEIATVAAAYTATGLEQLSLTPGQLVMVRKKSPSGWWEGELQARGQKRKIGWFPANYVKLLSSSARNTPDPVARQEDRGPTPLPYPQPSSDPALEQVVALYAYEAQNDDELTLQVDSIVNVTNKDDASWWHGECNGTTGVFPANYVRALTDLTSTDNA